MRRISLAAALAVCLAVPAGAQSLKGVLVDPPSPTTLDRIDLTVVGTEYAPCTFGWQDPSYDAFSHVFNLSASLPDCVTPPAIEFRKTFTVGPLAAGTYYALLKTNGLPYGNPYDVFRVREPEAALRLQPDDRFQVSVEWRNPKDGSHGSGHPVRFADDSGAFWFFSPGNLEATIKILDGRAVNGRWWVFLASMTDLEMTVTILENVDDCLALPIVPSACPTKTYVQAAGQSRNVIDVNAFEGSASPVPAKAARTADFPEDQTEIRIAPQRPTPLDPIHISWTHMSSGDPDLAFLGVAGHSIQLQYVSYEFPDFPPPIEAWSFETTVGPLPAGIYTIDAMEDFFPVYRKTIEVVEPSLDVELLKTDFSSFFVSVAFARPGSQSDDLARAVPLSDQSGYFWFFDPDNVEVTVKILDGRAVNGKYWVFLSSMTDVAFTATVTHCPSDAPLGLPCFFEKTYHGEPGVNANIIDVNFPGH